MTDYPATYPIPLVDGLGIGVGSGVIRADVPGAQMQRRVFKSMPHTFTLTFAMTIADWSDWQRWVSQYGYRWFNINLPSMYAGLAGLIIGPTLVRFVSPVKSASLPGNCVQLTVSAEIAPSMIARFREAV